MFSDACISNVSVGLFGHFAVAILDYLPVTAFLSSRPALPSSKRRPSFLPTSSAATPAFSNSLILAFSFPRIPPILAFFHSIIFSFSHSPILSSPHPPISSFSHSPIPTFLISPNHSYRRVGQDAASVVTGELGPASGGPPQSSQSCTRPALSSYRVS